MRFSFRLSRSVSAAPSSLTPAKSLQTTTTNTNDRSDHSAATELHLLPAPATTRDRQSRPRRNSKSVQISGGWRAYWAAFKKQIAPGTAPSSSSSPDDSTGTASYVHKPQGSTSGEQDGRVDVVVIDRLWGESPGRSTNSDPMEEAHAENRLGTTTTDHNSSEADSGFWASSPALVFIRWRLWPSIWGFFMLQFVDHKYEAHYVKETWFLRKRLALFSAAFFIINWLLPVILLSRPATLADKFFYYGVSCPGCLVCTTPSLTLHNRLAP